MKVMDKQKILELEDKLFNRFRILAFIKALGVEYAKGAIEPGPAYMDRELYLASYNNPQA
jgi:hypothetical protein